MDENNQVNMSTVEGDYYLLKKDNWYELEITLNTSESRVNRIPKKYKGTELRIYVNIANHIQNIGIIECEEYILLNKNTWKDVRKSQGDDKGKPYVVTESCLLRFPIICKNKPVKIYAQKKVK